MIAVVGFAFLLRIAAVGGQGYPFSFYPDEDSNLERAVNFYRPDSGTIDLNPHWFNKPTFTYYVNFGAFGFYYLAGRYVTGTFPTAESFGVRFMNDRGPFLVIARTINAIVGTLTVWALYRLVRGWRGRAVGVVAALLLAVHPGHVAWCRVVKEDVWATFFLVMGLLFAQKIVVKSRYRDAFAGGVFLGLGYAAKFHPIIALPILAIAHFVGGSRTAPRLRTRLAVLLVAFALGAFFGTPYSFLDEEGRGRIGGIVSFAGKMIGFGVGETDPNEALALLRQFGRLVVTIIGFGEGDWAMTIPGTILALIGLSRTFGRGRAGHGWIIHGTLYAALLALTAGNDQWPRKNHCVLVYPLLAAFAAVGIETLSELITQRRVNVPIARSRFIVFLAVVFFPAPGFPFWETADGIGADLAEHQNLRAFRFVQSNIPAGSTIVVDGEILPLRASDERRRWLEARVARRLESGRAELAKATDVAVRREKKRYVDRYTSYSKKYAFLARADATYGFLRYDTIVVEHTWQTESSAEKTVKVGAYNDLWEREPLVWPAQPTPSPECYRVSPSALPSEVRGRCVVLEGRPADFWVASAETYDNYRKPLKRREWPQWAAFYDDLKASYDAWEITGPDIRPTEVIRIWDLRRRVDEPTITVVKKE